MDGEEEYGGGSRWKEAILNEFPSFFISRVKNIHPKDDPNYLVRYFVLCLFKKSSKSLASIRKFRAEYLIVLSFPDLIYRYTVKIETSSFFDTCSGVRRF